jgi:hypothetical protein
LVGPEARPYHRIGGRCVVWLRLGLDFWRWLVLLLFRSEAAGGDYPIPLEFRLDVWANLFGYESLDFSTVDELKFQKIFDVFEVLFSACH